MNGNVLLCTDLCICCSDTPCSVGSVHELSLTCVCCTTTQFCSFLLAFGVVLLEVFWGWFFCHWWGFVVVVSSGFFWLVGLFFFVI